MPDDLATTIGAVVQRLISLAMGDAELRASLRQLAEQFLTQTAPPPTVIEDVTAGQQAEAVVLPQAPSPTSPPLPTHEPLPTVPGVEVPIGWVQRTSVADADLQLIESRCRLKAEGSRWAATRQRRLHDGEDFRTEIEPKDREIIDKAKTLPDCFLWMNHSSGPCPTNLELWEDVAGCFDAAADVLALVREIVGIDDNHPVFEKTLDLAAEVQSALRMAVEAVGGKADNDQSKIFIWLRSEAAQGQVYIQRFMRIDDPADPTAWNDLHKRIALIDTELQGLRKQKKQRQGRLQQCQYHAKFIREGKQLEYNWQKVINVIEEMVNDGIPHSNSDLRELLLPIVDDMPEMADLPPGFKRVLSEVDRFLATRPPLTSEVVREVTGDVREVAELLKGKAIVMIGGDRRPHAYDALKSALGVEEVIWIETREHESIEGFEAYIARPEVAVVMLAIRWSSHSYGDVQAFCEKHGKPLVRLPGGYNPNQVAHQIIEQCGERLRQVQPSS
jgi:hypothetical protein